MPTLVGPSPGTGLRVESVTISRLLVTVYARERLEDAIRAVAEDALNPGRPDFVPWQGDDAFHDDLTDVIRDIAATTNRQLVERLEALLETAPPSVKGRMSSGPRFPEQA